MEKEVPYQQPGLQHWHFAMLTCVCVPPFNCLEGQNHAKAENAFAATFGVAVAQIPQRHRPKRRGEERGRHKIRLFPVQE